MQIFERENGKKYALGRFLHSQRTQGERIFGGQQLKTIKDNFIFSSSQMSQKDPQKIKNKNGELNEKIV